MRADPSTASSLTPSEQAEELGRTLEFYFVGIASNATRTQGNYDRFMEALRELVALASNQGRSK